MKKKGVSDLRIWTRKRKTIRCAITGILFLSLLLSGKTVSYGAQSQAIEQNSIEATQEQATDKIEETTENTIQQETESNREQEEEQKEEQQNQQEQKEQKDQQNGREEQTEKIERREMTESDQICYLQTDSSEIAAYSFDNSSVLPINNVRYDKFLSTTGGPGTASSPNMGMGIKYVVDDEKNVDGGGKWRYVYCVEYAKDCPIGGIKMEFTRWGNRKITYAMYYGALYYGQTCRYTPYSTGNWQMDYFVTQVAIHILNGEYTLAAAKNGMNRSTATAAEKNLAYDRISKIVDDANNTGNYGGFTSDGWMDMNHATFTLNGYKDSWSLKNGKYLSDGKFHGVFNSYYGYDFREQITGYDIAVPEGVSVQKNGKQTYADFQLGITQAQYQKWQLTGKQIPVTVTASIPRYWGAGIYVCKTASNFQSICLLTWDGSGGTTRLQAKANMNINPVTQDLTIYKKDQDDHKNLTGAAFSLWAYDGTEYSKKVGDFTDLGDGSYEMKNIAYTATKDGWFLIKEDRAPENYSQIYQWENSQDEEDYRQYGGREIRMNENGFYSDRVEDPKVFFDKKADAELNITLKKYDIVSGKLLEDGEFQIFSWINDEGKYSEIPEQTLQFNKETQQYQTTCSIKWSESNQGKFLVKETKSPKHYCGVWQQEITVQDPGITNLELEAYNYPERKFVIRKKIREDEIVWEHGTPTFFFKISGTDLNGTEHWYQSMIRFTKESQKQDGYLVGKVEISQIPAGYYQVEELPLTARYILTDAVSTDKNVQVKNTLTETVNGIGKIRSEIEADLTLQDGSVTFENRKVFFDEYSHDDTEVNHLKAAEEKR